MKMPNLILAGALIAILATAAAAQPAPGTLPADHAVIEPGTTAPGKGGTITIRVVQGTKDAPPVGADPVLIEYYDPHNHVAGKTPAALNDKGELKIENIPLNVVFTPLVTVTHAGVKYQTVGKMMTTRQPTQHIHLTVFESTDKEPEWQVRMRHIICEPSSTGLGVTDMISAFNPGDRTWTGKPQGGGKLPVTVSVALPANATQVHLADGGEVIDGKAVWALPMLPGATELQVKYIVPAQNDKADVQLWAPAATKSFMVFIPDDGTIFTGEKFSQMQPKPGSGLKENSRFFTAAPHNAGEQIRFAVANLKNARPVGPGMAAGPKPAADDAGFSTIVKVVVGLGAGAILVVGAAIIFLKSPKPVEEAAGKKKRKQKD